MRIFPATLLKALRIQRRPTRLGSGHARPRARGFARVPPRGCWSPRSEAGDTLIEVLMSAVLVALIVVATLSGLDSTNRATALSRARSEADVLAQQAQDRLRSEPVLKLSELNQTETIKQNGTVYTIASTAAYRSDTTATASCTTSGASPDYIETRSKVTWPSMGVSTPVVESSIISPPPGTALLVQVLNSGAPVPNVNAVATGPAPSTGERVLETSGNGCAVFSVFPGEYGVNVYRSGYVTPNGQANSREDPLYAASSTKFLVAETTATLTVEEAPAGLVEATFVTAGVASPKGDSFTLSNSAMSAERTFGTIGTYSTAIASPKTIFPFPAAKQYSAFAGSCGSDAPEAVGAVEAPEFEVPASGTAAVKVVQPPLKIRVMSGTKEGSSTEGSPVSGATVHVKDTKCSTVRATKTTSTGTFEQLGFPFGTYEVCVTGGTGATNRQFVTPVFANDTEAGPSKLETITNDSKDTKKLTAEGYATVYMQNGADTTVGSLTANSTCPW
jgi:Tfp pilus assembly protein PilV